MDEIDYNILINVNETVYACFFYNRKEFSIVRTFILERLLHVGRGDRVGGGGGEGGRGLKWMRRK